MEVGQFPNGSGEIPQTVYLKPYSFYLKKTLKRFIIKTLGCKVNQCESEGIGNALIDSGYVKTADDDETVHVVIVNTCTVTSKASMQSRQAVRQAIRSYPGARVVVTGCHAQTAAAELAAIDGVDWVVGNPDKHNIPKILLADTKPLVNDTTPMVCCPDISTTNRFEGMPGIAHGSRTRPFLKIQDGCNAFCTYCIVPHARGRSRSLPMEQVLHQIEQLGRLGYREVVLTGIHIGCYGQDLHPSINLYDLLRRIQDASTIDRIRVSSIEPAELTDDIVNLAVGEDAMAGQLCRHFHIPLQSGDDQILRRMHRPYDRDYFRALVHGILDRVPDAAIGVDTLIGFPGETDEAFENTHELIESLPVAYLHVFPFSARKGTPAFSFKQQVPTPEIKVRCSRMRQLGAEKRNAFYQRNIGKTVTVLVEETRDRMDGRLKGLTDNYLPVHFCGPDEYYNTFQTVGIEGFSRDGGLEGRGPLANSA
jgi:threonylcarbamoyladenosine tRNA methylthiotransferase MtaB